MWEVGISETELKMERASRLSSQSAMTNDAMSTLNCQHRVRWRIMFVLRARDSFHGCTKTEAFRWMSSLRGWPRQKCPNSLWNFTEKNNFYLPAQKYCVCTRKEICQSRRQHGRVARANSICARDVSPSGPFQRCRFFNLSEAPSRLSRRRVCKWT